jgi:Ca-activated chloride channel family protein
MRRLAFAFVVIAAASLEAQQPAFRAGVELVTIPVTVTSLDRNTFITGLTPADFRVTENGDRQSVTMVTRERVPVSIVFVVDSSEMMTIGQRRQMAAAAVDRMVELLADDDEISILFVSRRVEERMAWTRAGKIEALNWGGWVPGTASVQGQSMSPLNDGLRAALDTIERAANPRRAIVVLTPGFEGSSRMSVASLVKTRQQSETLVFGVGLGSSDPRVVATEEPHVKKLPPGATSDMVRTFDPGAPGAFAPRVLPDFDYLETIVGDSGGMVSRVLTLPEAGMAARNVIAELQNQYLVGYVPTKPFDGKYRNVKVQLNRRGLYIRHRGGYLAVASTPQ